MANRLSAPSVIDLPESKYAAHQRMANAIIDVTLEKGRCLPQDLLPMGFLSHETIALFHMANEMASVELRLMKSRERYAASR